jgi:hypothetical protein
VHNLSQRCPHTIKFLPEKFGSYLKNSVLT